MWVQGDPRPHQQLMLLVFFYFCHFGDGSLVYISPITTETEHFFKCYWSFGCLLVCSVFSPIFLLDCLFFLVIRRSSLHFLDMRPSSVIWIESIFSNASSLSLLLLIFNEKEIKSLTLSFYQCFLEGFCFLFLLYKNTVYSCILTTLIDLLINSDSLFTNYFVFSTYATM